MPRALWWSDAGVATRARCRARASNHHLRVSPLLDAYRCHVGRCAHHPAVYWTHARVAAHNLSSMEAKEQGAKTSDFRDMSYGASRGARARHAGAFADAAQPCSRSHSVFFSAVSQGHRTASPTLAILSHPALPCWASRPLLPLGATVRASARSVSTTHTL